MKEKNSIIESEMLLENESETEELADASPENLDTFNLGRRPIAQGRDGWLTWDAFHRSTELDHAGKEDNYALYAFMIAQVEGGGLIDSSDPGHHTNTVCYPYAATFGDKPLPDGAFWSVKEEGFTTPFLLHRILASKIANKQTLTTMDYCISRYLESNDPYYFCLHYLTYGAKKMRSLFRSYECSLDAHAKTWFIGQFAIAEKVKKQMVKGFTKGSEPDMTPLEYLHHILTTSTKINKQATEPLSTLKDLLDVEEFVEGYAVYRLRYLWGNSEPSEYLQAFTTKYVN